MTGALPPPIGPWTLLTRWSLSPLPVVGCIAAVTWYLSNARRVASAGHPVPIRRRIAFVSGVAVVMVALASSIDAYADVSFSVHMVQHLLLSFVAPPLLALGAPVALALRSASPSGRARLSAVLRSRAVRALTRPVIGFVAFAGLPFVLHFSPIYDLALRDTWVHALEHLALLGAGVVYWWPLVGSDPVPHRPSHIARVVSLLLLLPVESFLSLAIYSADAPLYPTYANLAAPFGPNALADQQGAAALMWVVGAAVTISITLAAAAAWRRDDEARQRRLERLEDERAASAG